jgi:hypothetical protein
LAENCTFSRDLGVLHKYMAVEHFSCERQKARAKKKNGAFLGI